MSARIIKLMGSRYQTGFAPQRHRVGPGDYIDLPGGHTLHIGQALKSDTVDMVAIIRKANGQTHQAPLHHNMMSDLSSFGFFIAPRAVEYTQHGIVRTVWLELYSIDKAMSNLKRTH